MDDEALERDVLGHVDKSRREFVRRLVIGSVFAVPVVSSFDMSSLTMSSAGAQVPNGSPPLPASPRRGGPSPL